MKKIIGVAFIFIATLFLFSCLDAIPEPSPPPPTLEGGGRSPFTYNERKLNGFAEGTAKGYEDTKGTAPEGVERIIARIWMVEGIIARATIITSHETRGYGRDLGPRMANIILEANSIDISTDDLDFETETDTITYATPRGGRAVATFSAVLQATENAINKIAQDDHRLEGGGVDKNGNKIPWTWDKELIEEKSDSIEFTGWMPHNSFGEGDPTYVTIEIKDGLINEVHWEGADWDCRADGEDGNKRTSFGGRMLRRLTYYFETHNRIIVEDFNKIVDSRGNTIAVDDEHEHSLYDPNRPDTFTRATGTIEEAIPAAQRAFQNLILKVIDSHLE